MRTKIESLRVILYSAFVITTHYSKVSIFSSVLSPGVTSNPIVYTDLFSSLTVPGDICSITNKLDCMHAASRTIDEMVNSRLIVHEVFMDHASMNRPIHGNGLHYSFQVTAITYKVHQLDRSDRGTVYTRNRAGLPVCILVDTWDTCIGGNTSVA